MHEEILEVKKHIEEWIHQLSIARKELNGFKTCPYAAHAKYEIYVFIGEAKQGALSWFCEDAIGHWAKGGRDVGIIVDLTATLGPEEMRDFAKTLNARWTAKNVVLLDDHPETSFEINGLKTTNGRWPLLIIQHLDKLQEKSKKLKKFGYYNTWSEAAIADVVRWRGK